MERRDFLKAAGVGIAGGMLMKPETARAKTGRNANPTTFLLSNNGCGRATGYAETNKIVTLRHKTHVAWLDSENDTFLVRIRTLDRQTGEWSPAYTVGNAYDNHGGPALTCDSQGFLHIVYYPHHHPFRYRRSKRPNDASEWEEEVRFGNRCTYPTLIAAPDDTLVLTCRESNREGKPWVVNKYTKKPGETWSEPTAILVADEGGYAHFQDALAWGNDRKTVHLSTRMYGGKPGRAHTVGYMRSPDGGLTWENAYGKQLQLPATSDTLTVLDRAEGKKGAGFRCGAMAVAPNGIPVVLYSNTSLEPAEAWLVHLLPGGTQTRQRIGKAVRRIEPGAAVAMPGGLSVDARGRVHIVLTMVPPGQRIGWGNPANEIVYLSGEELGAPLSAHPWSQSDMTVPHWLPNMERPTGHNAVDHRPGVIFQSGSRGRKNTDILKNQVIWIG